MNPISIIDRFQGCLLGLAVGDAVGAAVEFRERGTFPPVQDMLGGGPFGLKAGEWTDDTSMALCLAESLIAKGGFDARDQMERYWRWYQEGYLSSNGACFDVGSTVRSALERFQQTGDPFSGSADAWAAGNGSIMRLAPVALYYYPDRDAVLRYSAESSRTTHATAECIEACRLLGDILYRGLRGDAKESVLFGSDRAAFSSDRIADIAQGAYRSKPESGIRGSGYVVESLEAALWCAWKSESFKQTILAAVNLGDDSDTTAAICGQVAGAMHGIAGIPEHWRERLVMKEEIGRVAKQLMRKKCSEENRTGNHLAS